VPEQQKAREIEELTQRLSELKEQKNKLNAEANEWGEKRNKLNERFKSLRAEILELKDERDKLNEKVKEQKQQREEAKTEIHEKIEELRKLNQEINALTKKKPSRSLQTLKEEVESIDWKIQTTPLSLEFIESLSS
jgi:chromosome segregation protein